LGKTEIVVEKLVGSFIGQTDGSQVQGVTELSVFPLYSFASFLGVKYMTAIVITAVIFSITIEALGSGKNISVSLVVLSFFIVTVMLLVLAFIAFVIYKLYIGEHFYYVPLMSSAFIIFLVASLAVTGHSALSDNSGFHILQVLLPLIASLAIAAIFSAFVIVAQRLISS
jgi:hypothetical protein